MQTNRSKKWNTFTQSEWWKVHKSITRETRLGDHFSSNDNCLYNNTASFIDVKLDLFFGVIKIYNATTWKVKYFKSTVLTIKTLRSRNWLYRVITQKILSTVRVPSANFSHWSNLYHFSALEGTGFCSSLYINKPINKRPSKEPYRCTVESVKLEVR